MHQPVTAGLDHTSQLNGSAPAVDTVIAGCGYTVWYACKSCVWWQHTVLAMYLLAPLHRLYSIDSNAACITCQQPDTINAASIDEVHYAM